MLSDVYGGEAHSYGLYITSLTLVHTALNAVLVVPNAWLITKFNSLRVRVNHCNARPIFSVNQSTVDRYKGLG